MYKSFVFQPFEKDIFDLSAQEGKDFILNLTTCYKKKLTISLIIRTKEGYIPKHKIFKLYTYVLVFTT